MLQHRLTLTYLQIVDFTVATHGGACQSFHYESVNALARLLQEQSGRACACATPAVGCSSSVVLNVLENIRVMMCCAAGLGVSYLLGG